MSQPQPLWPPVLIIGTPTGEVTFWWDDDVENIIPFDIRRTTIRRSELDALGKKLGRKFKDAAKCNPNSTDAEYLADDVVGYRFSIKTMPNTGLPYDLAHHIRVLLPNQTVTMRTNWIDRTRDETYTGLYVEDDPDIPYEVGGEIHGQEYYVLNNLTLITILEDTP